MMSRSAGAQPPAFELTDPASQPRSRRSPSRSRCGRRRRDRRARRSRRSDGEGDVGNRPRAQAIDLQDDAAGADASLGKRSCRGRPSPDHVRVVSSAIGVVTMWRPSRITVTRSQSAKISSMRCEIRRERAPRPQRRDELKSRFDLGRVSAAVGSSMMRMRVRRERLGDLDELLVGDRKPAREPVGVEVDPEPVKARPPRVASAEVDAPEPLRGCTPMKMFSATVRSGNSVGSWKMIAMPAACDGGAVEVAASPSTSTARRRAGAHRRGS